MDKNNATRQIVALTAIVQTMMAEHYGTLSQEQARAKFEWLAAGGDPLAIAISNELSPEAIERALAASECSLATREEVLNAIPAFQFLTEAQRERARVAPTGRATGTNPSTSATRTRSRRTSSSPCRTWTRIATSSES